MGDSMGDERITIIVEDEQRDRWEQYIDEQSDANNMSHLLRMAVEDYISDEEDNGELESEQIDNVEEDVERLRTEVKQVQDTLQVIKGNQMNEDDLYYLVESAVDGVVEI